MAWGDVPYDLCITILAHLPSCRDKKAFSQVCKRWRDAFGESAEACTEILATCNGGYGTDDMYKWIAEYVHPDKLEAISLVAADVGEWVTHDRHDELHLRMPPWELAWVPRH